MFFDTNTEKILEAFLKKPTEPVQIREIIKLTKLGNPTVSRGLGALAAKGYVRKKKGKIYPYYEARTDSPLFRKAKLAYTLVSLEEIIKNIAEKARPNCIVLFGSAARGEDTEKSDIDLFVQAERRAFDTRKAERRLNRKINMLFEPEIGAISKELANTLANGIVVYGFLEVVK